MADQSDLLDIARKFNDAVAATAAVGALRADLADVKTDLIEVKGDVKHIRTTTDRWGGGILVVSAVASAVVSIATAIVTAVFFK